MKGTIKTVAVIVVIAGLLIYSLLTGIIELTNTEKLQTIEVDYAAGCMDLEHSINGLIPIGTDHFYYAYSEKTDRLYILSAEKNWLDKNFDAEGLPKVEGFAVKTYRKSLDYKVRRELEKEFGEALNKDELALDITTYQDAQYTLFAIYKIAGAALAALAALFLWLGTKKANKALSFGGIASLLCSCVLLLMAMR